MGGGVVMDGLGAALQALADFLFDERCHHCGRRIESGVETGAANARDALARPVCVANLGPVRLHTRVLCRRCTETLHPCTRSVSVSVPRGCAGPPAGDVLPVFPAFEAEARLLTLVHLIKFAKQRRLSPWLASAVAVGLPRVVLAECAAPPVLVPVPMDRRSRTRRGFNQAEELARGLSRAWKVPMVADALVKTRCTAAQSLLDREARRRNLRDAFAPGPGQARVAGRCVVIVDDLVTTGATAAACAAALGALASRDVRVVCAGYRP